MRSTATSTGRRRASGALMALLAMLAVTLGASVAAAPGAIAAPCLTCEPDPGPPPPGGPSLPTYKVWADGSNYLAVVETEDNGNNNDEAYIRVNNSTVWGPKSVSPGSPGNAHFYGVSFAALVTGSSFSISLYDEDWPDDDDNLGWHTIGLPGLQSGQTVPMSREFTEDGAYYSLTFKITRIS